MEKCCECNYIEYFIGSPHGCCKLQRKPRFNRKHGWIKSGCKYKQAVEEGKEEEMKSKLELAIANKIEEMDEEVDPERQVAIKIEGVDYLSEENRGRIRELNNGKV